MNRILSHLMEILSNKRNISISYLTFASRSHFEASAWIMDPSAMIEISHHAHFQSRVNVFWELSVDKFPRRLTSHQLIDIRHLVQPEKGKKIEKMTHFSYFWRFHENSYSWIKVMSSTTYSGCDIDFRFTLCRFFTFIFICLSFSIFGNLSTFGLCWSLKMKILKFAENCQ